MLHIACERSGLILSLFDHNIPSRKNFKERKYSRILTFFFFLVPLVVDILEFTLVKVILCLFSKNDSAYQTNNYDTDGSCGMD